MKSSSALPHPRHLLRNDVQRRRHAVLLPPPVVRPDHARRPHLLGLARVFGAVHALHDERPVVAPRLLDPAQVVPRHGGRGQLRRDVGVGHRAAFGIPHVHELHQPTVADVIAEPRQPGEHLRGDLELARGDADPLLDTPPAERGRRLHRFHLGVERAQSGDARIDREDERGEPGPLGALDAAQRRLPAAAEVELEPAVPRGGRGDLFHRRARERGERHHGAELAGDAGRDGLALGREHAQAADGRDKPRHGEVVADRGRVHVERVELPSAVRRRHGLLEGADVRTKRGLRVGPAAEVLRDDGGHALLHEPPEVGGRHRIGQLLLGSGHLSGGTRRGARRPR